MDGVTSTFVEIAWPPFAYVLTIDTEPEFVQTCEITNFAHVDYDERMEFGAELLIGFAHTIYPCDYRTMAMLERDRKLT